MTAHASHSIALIVACDEARGIGRGGALPWHLPSDLANFKRVTTTTASPRFRNAVLMGRRTWESIPVRFRPLPARKNVVLTRSGALTVPPGVVLAPSFDVGLAAASNDPSIERVFIIGGAAVYTAALRHPSCESVQLTRVLGNFGCDVFLAPFEESFELTDVSGEHENNGIRFRFERWRRVKR